MILKKINLTVNAMNHNFAPLQMKNQNWKKIGKSPKNYDTPTSSSKARVAAKISLSQSAVKAYWIPHLSVLAYLLPTVRVKSSTLPETLIFISLLKFTSTTPPESQKNLREFKTD
jgi:hypothetical protein